MSPDEFKRLKRGDLVRHKQSRSRAYVVMANYGDRVTAATTADLTNPAEWVRVNSDGTVKEEGDA